MASLDVKPKDEEKQNKESISRSVYMMNQQ